MRTRFAVHTAIFAFAIALVLSFNNCTRVTFDGDLKPSVEKLQLQNVFVGNPFTSSTKIFLAEICDTLTRCHPNLTPNACETGALSSGGIDYQLGLPKGSVSSLNEIAQMESSGSISANSSAIQSCSTAIKELSCSDPSVQKAFDALSPTPFAGLSFMIPTAPGSCPAVFNQPPSQQEYYVATTGSDSNDGSRERPWATITHASKALTLGAAGTIVHVAPGSYSFPLQPSCPGGLGPCAVITTRSGTANAPITFISDEQGKARISPAGASTIWYNSGDHVKIIGFEIVGTNISNWGLFSDGSFGQVIGNHIHNIPNPKGCSESLAGGGIVFGFYAPSNDNDAIGNLIHDIGPFPGNGLADSSYCNHSMGIAYRQPRGKIFNNIIYRSGTWGINTFVQATDLQISNNLLFNNGAKSSSGRLIGGGILISAESGVGVIENTTVSNNIIRNNSGYGLAEYDAVSNRNAYLNNLMFENSQDWLLLSGVTHQGTLTTDPLMISFQANGSGNYRLQISSPAINSGTNVCAAGSSDCTPTLDHRGLARPHGAKIDRGPFEWHP